jgi:hypothetical protein
MASQRSPSRRLAAEVYGWFWRHVPGPWPVRALVAVALLVAVVVLLFTVVFPWAEQALPFLDVTVEG